MGKLHGSTILAFAIFRLILYVCFNITWVDMTNNSIIFELDNGLVGFVDIHSKTLHPAKYDAISDSECQDFCLPILVCENGCWGYVDRVTGNYIVPNKYNARADSEFNYGYAIIGAEIGNDIDSGTFLFDKDGKRILFPAEHEPESQVDKNSNLIIRNIETNTLGIAHVDTLTASIKIPSLYAYIDYYDDYACLFLDNYDAYTEGESYQETLFVVSISRGDLFLCVEDYPCIDDEVYYSFSTPYHDVKLGLIGHSIVYCKEYPKKP